MRPAFGKGLFSVAFKWTGGLAASVWLDLLQFTLGLVLLVAGAEALVRGGGGLARRLGVSPLMIGLTVVALGTSAPELVVSLTASATGKGDVALGNVVGSNILNSFIVLGVIAALYPVSVARRTLREDLPFVLYVSLLVLLMAWDGAFGRMDGFILLACTWPYLAHLHARERTNRYVPPDATTPTRHPLLAVAGVGGGVLMLMLGGDQVVESGSAMARNWGVSERVIALTLVAFGTSAPELATGIAAAFRKQVDLAIGNVIGSNLLNLFLVLGGSAALAPIAVAGQAMRLDIPMMVLGAAILLQFASRRLRVTRLEGLVLVGIYGLYLGFLLGIQP